MGSTVVNYSFLPTHGASITLLFWSGGVEGLGYATGRPNGLAVQHFVSLISASPRVPLAAQNMMISGYNKNGSVAILKTIKLKF